MTQYRKPIQLCIQCIKTKKDVIFGKRKSNPRLIRSNHNVEKGMDFGESYLEISSGICSGLCEDSLITDY